MKKANVRSMMVLLLVLPICVAQGQPVPEIVLEAEPLHLLSCAAIPGDMTATTLAAEPDSPAVYQGAYRRDSFGGSLRKLVPDGGDWRSLWDAADRLAAEASTRRLFTSDAQGRLHALEWESLPFPLRQALDRSPDAREPDGLGRRRLAYLRGARDDERRHGGPFATRDSLLGAIVHGVPLPVAAPAGRGLSVAHQAFVDAHRHRSAAVFVGAADGMLHAFDQASGDELFAYVPHAMFDALPLLAHDARAAGLTVDGGMTAAEALVGGQWRTVLAVGMGRGAQGVLALDVSAPERFGETGGLIWEFGDRDDADIGNVIGTPEIVRLRVSVEGVAPADGYFVAVAGGVNGGRADGRASGNGTNVLFLLALDKPPHEKWQPGVNYFKLAAPGAGGMIELAPIREADGTAARAYAVDLQGRLWRFDLAAGAPWSETPQQLFAATTAEGRPQAVTHKPMVVHAPGGGHAVLFGTGKYLERADLDRARFETQSFYAVHDDGHAADLTRRDLVERVLLKSEGGDVFAVTADEGASAPFAAGRQGWYLDFPASAVSGERVASSAVLAGGSIVFHTTLPAAQTCQTPLARLHALDTRTGNAASANRTGFPVHGVWPQTAVVRHLPDRDAPPDAFGGRQPKPTIEVVSGGSAIPTRLQLEAPVLRAGRLGWRELLNWPELRDSANGR